MPQANNSPMNKESPPETFNSRFVKLKTESGLSFEGLSQAILARTGINISHAALHKYANGGNIDEPTLEALATYFGKTPAWFRYGIGETPTNTFEVIGDMVQQLADEPRQMVLNLLKYEFSESATRVISEPGVSVTYAEFLDRVIKDMAEKRKAAEANDQTKHSTS